MSAGHLDHSQVSRSRWWIVVLMGIATLVCGFVGTMEYEMALPDARVNATMMFDSAYSAFQMLAMHATHTEFGTNVWLEVGRWLGVVTLLSTTWILLWKRLRQEIRLIRLQRWWTGHYVICGLGQKGAAIVESIREREPGARIVILDPEPDAAHVEELDGTRVCIIRKDATDPAALKLARIDRAGEIIAVTVDDETNIRIAAQVRALRAGAAHAFCRVHITNSYLPEALQKWTDASTDASTSLRFFDVFDSEARRILLNQAAADDGGLGDEPALAPIDGPGIGPEDRRSVHVVILGTGRMGTGLTVRAAKMGQFANGRLLRISIIDPDAAKQSEKLLFRYPILAEPNEVCDLAMHAWPADSLQTRSFIEGLAREPDAIVHVFVCLDNNARAVEIGLRISEMLADHPDGHVSIRIRSKASLAPILKSPHTRIRAFGMLEDTCSEETFRGERVEALARGIHEDFVAARQAETGRQGDAVMAPWDVLREDFRESNRQQADHMAIKMRAIGCRIVEARAAGEAVKAFTTDEVEMLAKLEHRRWNAGRWLSGWKFGKETDKPRRIHNCLVPWMELTEEMKELDRVPVRSIPNWLARAVPPMKVIRDAAAKQ